MKKFTFVLLFLFGCMVGPNYREPKVSMPKQFLENKTKNASIVSLRNWWRIFNDKNLNEIIQKAINNNYDLKLAFEKIEQTRAQYRFRKADLFPEINMNAQAIRMRISQTNAETFFLPFPVFNIFQAGFDALWEIDVFGRLRREKEAAIYEFQASYESMRNVYITIISDAARYYIDICALQNIIELTKEKIECQKNILSLFENKKNYGLNSKLIVNDEISRLKEEEENLLLYNTILKQTVYRLAVILGDQPENSFNYSKFTKIPLAQDKIKAGLPSSLLRNRPDIREAERLLAESTAKIGAAVADYFPRFSLIGSIAPQTSKIKDFFKSNSLTWSVGSTMNWPIINFGRVKAIVDERKSIQRQALITYQNTILKALEDVESSFVAYYNESYNLKDIQKQVQVITENNLLNKDKYSKGLINYIDFLIQKKLVLDKKIKEKESERALCHNLVALYKALGGGEWDKKYFK